MELLPLMLLILRAVGVRGTLGTPRTCGRQLSSSGLCLLAQGSLNAAGFVLHLPLIDPHPDVVPHTTVVDPTPSSE